ncbi:flavin reductase family protein [Pseudomonas putida]|uniref:flavin reductase family protein n=1 Tax=Pseudomonas putida TaxID=303 RepID=UPI001F51857F|nr:flavin reductase family protein [Pseudomonas putida]MCI1024019.1 flavin reductase family protein [Pseudomonas putida]
MLKIENRASFEEAINSGQIAPVPLAKAYRLITHGPTVLVSARHEGVSNVMAAGWSCGLDFEPPKVTVVVDKVTATRVLMVGSGYFALQVPSATLLQLTYDVGNTSLIDDPEKLQTTAVHLFDAPDIQAPLVEGCIAWLLCRRIPEAHNEEAYDLFIGEVEQAWADTRVFRDGHWHFESAPSALRCLHYIAGGQFYAIGESLEAQT